MTIFEQAKFFVTNAFTRTNKPTDVLHAERTAHWLLVLRPEADEALLVAGLLHDIERAFHGDWKKGSDEPALLQKHQELSAAEVEKFLRSIGAEEPFIERVKHLIAAHETGGDPDQDLLCDADCLAWFEEKALRRARAAKEAGRIVEMTKQLEYVFSRIHGATAQQLAKPFCEAAQEVLK